MYAKSGKETELFLPDEYYQNLNNNIGKMRIGIANNDGTYNWLDR